MKGENNMPRPYKPIALSTGKISKEEREKRKEMEDQLKGKSDKLKAPTYLTKGAKKYFKFIVNELEGSGILSNLDVFVITQTSIALDEFQTYEIMKQSASSIDDRIKMGKYQDMLVKQNKSNFTELGLSPASRSKLSNMKIEKQEEQLDPVVVALRKLKESRE